MLLLSRAVLSILTIVLFCVGGTQAGCIHLKRKIENPTSTKWKSVNSMTPWRTTRNPGNQNTGDFQAEKSQGHALQDIDLSISICSSKDSSSESRRDRDDFDPYSIDSFEVVLPSLRVLSKQKAPLRFRVPTHSYRPPPSGARRTNQATSKKTPPPNKHMSDVSPWSSEGHSPTIKETSRLQSPQEPPISFLSRPFPPNQQPQYSSSHLPVTFTPLNNPSYLPPSDLPQQPLPPPPSCNLAPPTQQFYSPSHLSSYTPTTYPHSNLPLTLFTPVLMSSSRDLQSKPLADDSINEQTFNLPSPAEPSQSTSLQLYQPRRQSVQEIPDNEYLQPSYTPVESQPMYSDHASLMSRI